MIIIIIIVISIIISIISIIIIIVAYIYIYRERERERLKRACKSLQTCISTPNYNKRKKSYGLKAAKMNMSWAPCSWWAGAPVKDRRALQNVADVYFNVEWMIKTLTCLQAPCSWRAGAPTKDKRALFQRRAQKTNKIDRQKMFRRVQKNTKATKEKRTFRKPRAADERGRRQAEGVRARTRVLRSLAFKGA